MIRNKPYWLGMLFATSVAHAQMPSSNFNPHTPSILENSTALPQPDAQLNTQPKPVAPVGNPNPSVVNNTSIDQLMSQPELFTQVLTQMIANGQIDALEKTLPYYEKVKPRDETMYLYAQGLVARNKGHFALAIKKFRSILINNPDYTGVRLDLAATLMMSGADESATYHYQEALADTKLTSDTRKYIEASLAQLAKRRSWSVNMGASYLYDANINNASSDEYVTIFGLPFKKNAEAMPQKAQGWQATLDASKLFTIHDQHKIRLGVSLSNKDYDLNRFDAQDGRADLGYFWSNGLSLVYAGIYAVGRRFDHQVSERSEGLRLSANQFLSPHWSINASYDYLRNRFPTYQRLDGHLNTWSLGANYAIKPTMSISTGFEFSKRHAVDETLAYNEWAARLGFTQDLNFGLTYTASVRYAQDRYRGDAPFFGGTRKDQEVTPQITLAWQKLNFYGFIPRLTIAYVNHSSNIPLYEYKKWNSFVTLDKRF